MWCANNERQMMIAWASLEPDGRDTIPEMTPIEAADHWVIELRRILTKPNIVAADDPMSWNTCPEMQRNQPAGLNYGIYELTYVANTQWINVGQNNSHRPWDELINPSEYPWFADTEIYILYGFIGPWTGFSMPSNIFGEATWGVGFHHPNEQANVAYGDGSVRQADWNEIESEGYTGGVPTWFYNR